MSTKKVWFITGASRGLGLEITKAVLAAGHNVVATARNPSVFDSELGTSSSLLTVSLDVTIPEQAEDAVAVAIERFGRIDVLLNNAGYGQLGWFENTSDQQIRRQFETNVFGPMNVTRAVLPIMRAQRSGQIFTISSAAGFFSVAGSTTYSSSKFAVEGWMEGLAQEVKPFGIFVTTVGPGFFNTDFLDSSSVSYASNNIDDYAPQVQEFMEWHDHMNHNQVGDPYKLGEVLIQLSEAENPPVRFAAGSDAYNVSLTKIKTLTDEAEQWKNLSSASDSTL